MNEQSLIYIYSAVAYIGQFIRVCAILLTDIQDVLLSLLGLRTGFFMHMD